MLVVVVAVLMVAGTATCRMMPCWWLLMITQLPIYTIMLVQLSRNNPQLYSLSTKLIDLSERPASVDR